MRPPTIYSDVLTRLGNRDDELLSLPRDSDESHSMIGQTGLDGKIYYKGRSKTTSHNHDWLVISISMAIPSETATGEEGSKHPQQELF